MGADEPGRLTTETVEERQARLMPPAEPVSRVWRRVRLALLLVLAVSAGVFLGALPGSAAVGRHPVWELYALADRLEDQPAMTSCGPIAVEAHVDLLTSRVVVVGYRHDLSDEELAMVTWEDAEARPAPSVRITRIAVGAPTLCMM